MSPSIELAFSSCCTLASAVISLVGVTHYHLGGATLLDAELAIAAALAVALGVLAVRAPGATALLAWALLAAVVEVLLTLALLMGAMLMELLASSFLSVAADGDESVDDWVDEHIGVLRVLATVKVCLAVATVLGVIAARRRSAEPRNGELGAALV